MRGVASGLRTLKQRVLRRSDSATAPARCYVVTRPITPQPARGA
jgi:hypothetical protein